MKSAYHYCYMLFFFAQHPKADISKLELVASMDGLPPVTCCLQGHVFDLTFREFLKIYVLLGQINVLGKDSSLILGLANFVLLNQHFVAAEPFAILSEPPGARGRG